MFQGRSFGHPECQAPAHIGGIQIKHLDSPEVKFKTEISVIK